MFDYKIKVISLYTNKENSWVIFDCVYSGKIITFFQFNILAKYINVLSDFV